MEMLERMYHSQATFYILTILIFTLIFLIGTTVASYLYDRSLQSPEEAKNKKARSRCPHCGHAYTIAQAWPVFSYFRYHGKCMYCFEPMEKQKLAAELFGGVGYLAAAGIFRMSWMTGIVLVWITCCMGAYFARKRLTFVPVSYAIVTAVCGIARIVFIYENLTEGLILSLAGVCMIGIPIFAFRKWKAKPLAGNDILFLLAAGVLPGMFGVGAALVIAYIVWLVRLLRSRRQAEHKEP